MGKRYDITQEGREYRFSSTRQPANPGRKPSLFNHIKRLVGVEATAELSREDYYRLIGCLLERPLEDLKRLATDPKTPVWIVGIVRAIVKDAQAGRMNTIDSLFDRLFGKASQPLTGKDGKDLMPTAAPISVTLDAEAAKIIQSIGKQTSAE